MTTIQRVRSLHECGDTPGEIASSLQISRQLTYRYLKSLGLPPNRAPRRFCVNGHTQDENSRNAAGHCKACLRAVARRADRIKHFNEGIEKAACLVGTLLGALDLALPAQIRQLKKPPTQEECPVCGCPVDPSRVKCPDCEQQYCNVCGCEVEEGPLCTACEQEDREIVLRELEE